MARALVEGLDEGCLIYHSYPWLRPNRHGAAALLREGEADFVIIHPAAGLFVLEVKGGDVFFDPDTLRWYRRAANGVKDEIRDPFKQAEKNLHELKRQILERSFPGYDRPPFPYGYGAVFPDCEYHGDLPPGAAAPILFVAHDLPYLGRRVREAIQSFGHCETLPPETLRKIERGLSSTFRLVPLLARAVQQQEEQLVRLTNDQESALAGLYQYERVLVAGTAGSGKTMLAMAKAHDFAERYPNKKVLLVCYNRLLADHLRTMVRPEATGRIAVYNYHWLCSDWCRKPEARQRGIRYDPPPESTPQARAFWRDAAPDLLDRALAAVPDRFGAIIVNEAQDFWPNWWLSLELLNERGEEGPIYVFYDPDQNVNRRGDIVLPGKAVRYQLPVNCRNTREIAATCAHILGMNQRLRTREDSPQGEPPRLEIATDVQQQKALCGRELDRWIRRGRLGLNQVAILAPRRAQSSIADVTSLRDIPLTEDLAEWRSGKAVLVETIKRFKGMEADAVLLIDIPIPVADSSFTLADLYVACSRAKHLVTILATTPEVVSLVCRADS